MLITVIVPYYNNSKTIRRTLESLWGQTCCKFTIIIVDDCSDDSNQLMSVLGSFDDKICVEVCRHESRRNGAVARNTGAELAGTEYVAFLDSDDSWHSTRIEYLIQLVENRMVDSRTLLYGKVNLYRGDHFVRTTPCRPIRRDELVGDYVFASRQMMQTSSFFCSKYLATKVGFNSLFTRHQDSSFAMKAQFMGFILFFDPNALVNYYFPEDGLRKRIVEGRIGSKYCDFWLREMQCYMSRNAVLGYNIFVKGRVLYKEGFFVDAFGTILSSIFRFKIEYIKDVIDGLLINKKL